MTQLNDDVNFIFLQKTHRYTTRHDMVFILDGNSETGAHVRMNLCYLICSRL